jgi:hypothetical protein
MDLRLVPISLMICVAGYLFAERELSNLEPSSAPTLQQSGSQNPATVNGRTAGVDSCPGETPQDPHVIPEQVSRRSTF